MRRRLSGAPAAAAGIGLSRVAGLVRAALVTNVLGVGTVGDAFAAAQRIPNVLQNLLGEGALTAAFVPEYSATVDDDEDAAGDLAGAIGAFLLALTSVFVLIGVLAARPITRVIAWGFEGERFELTVDLVRIITVGTGLLVMTSWCLGILNSHRRFFLSYVAPVIWNAAQIATLVTVVLLGWSSADIAEALAWALVAGAAVQLMVQLPAVWRANRRIRLRHPHRVPAARRVMRRFGPAVLGRGAMQLSGFIDLALATLLAVGAAAAMAAAQTLYILPISIIGISVVATELPEISRLQGGTERATRLQARLLETGFLMSGVVAVYLAAASPLVDSVFNFGGWRDQVASDDILLIALTLGAYSLGLPALVGSRLMQNSFYAEGDTSTPARIALVRITVSLAVGLSLMFPLDRVLVLDGALSGFGDLGFTFAPLEDAIRHNGALPARLGAVGLAVGAACGAWVELAMLRTALVRRWQVPRLVETGLRRHLVPPLAGFAVGTAIASLTDIAHPVADFALIAIPAAAAHIAIGAALRCSGAQPLVSALRRLRTPTAEAPKDEDHDDRRSHRH